MFIYCNCILKAWVCEMSPKDRVYSEWQEPNSKEQQHVLAWYSIKLQEVAIETPPTHTHRHQQVWGKKTTEKKFQIEMIVSDGKWTHRDELQLLKYVIPSLIKHVRKLRLLWIEPQTKMWSVFSHNKGNDCEILEIWRKQIKWDKENFNYFIYLPMIRIISYMCVCDMCFFLY